MPWNYFSECVCGSVAGGPAKGTAMAKVGINGQGRHLLERIHTDGDGSTVFNGDRKRGAESPEEVNPAKVARLQIEALERHQEVMNQTLDACTDPRKAQPLPVPSDMNNTDSSMESSSETVATTEKGANSTETSATNNAISTDCDMAETPTEQTSIKGEWSDEREIEWLLGDYETHSSLLWHC